ncbi:hypothetical protein NLG97_g8238 [Lecanicillium saksenae]|uniref:Uncharacterized protein n=1 Tax=Lecanicillium saksenae TaxID=468837 RepID=A0ACC1QJK1_9HYPO|nr:hypothetical protein NLG97_g8238 [Lecanicillium saksenae]
MYSTAGMAINASYTGNCSSHAKTITYLGATPYVNSTATVTFDARHIYKDGDHEGHDKPWYYYVTLTQSEGKPLTNQWIGVPESVLEANAFNYTRICTYMVEGRDGGSRVAEGNKTCDGIISDQCVETFSKPKSTAADMDECPRQFDLEPCNTSFLASSSDTLSRDKTCFARTLPGITLPDGYVAAAIAGRGGIPNAGDNEYASYDDSFRRIIPTVIVFYKREQTGTNATLTTAIGTQRLCAAPNEAQPGSRSESRRNFDLSLTGFAMLGILLLV